MNDAVSAEDPYSEFHGKKSAFSIPTSMRGSNCDFKFRVAHTNVEIHTHKALLLHHCPTFQTILDNDCDDIEGITRLWCDDEVSVYWDGLKIIVEALYRGDGKDVDWSYANEADSLLKDLQVWLGAQAFGFKGFEALARTEFTIRCKWLRFDTANAAKSSINVVEFCNSFENLAYGIDSAKFFPEQLARKLCRLNCEGSRLSAVEATIQAHCNEPLAENAGWKAVKSLTQKMIGEAMSAEIPAGKLAAMRFPFEMKNKFCDIELCDVSTGGGVDTHKVLLAYHSPVLAELIETDLATGRDGNDVLYLRSSEDVPFNGLMTIVDSLYHRESCSEDQNLTGGWPDEDFVVWLNATMYKFKESAAQAKDEFVKHCDAISFEGTAREIELDGNRLYEFSLIWSHGRYQKDFEEAVFFRDYIAQTIARLKREYFDLPAIKEVLAENPDWVLQMAKYLKGTADGK